MASAPRRRAVMYRQELQSLQARSQRQRTRRPTTTGGPAKAFVMAKQRPASTSPTSALSTSTATSPTRSPHLALPVLLGERVVHPVPVPRCLDPITFLGKLCSPSWVAASSGPDSAHAGIARLDDKKRLPWPDVDETHDTEATSGGELTDEGVTVRATAAEAQANLFAVFSAAMRRSQDTVQRQDQAPRHCHAG